MAKPHIEREQLDPTGRALHKRVETTGYTVDTVASPGTSVPHRHAGVELVFVHHGAAVWWVGDWMHVLVPGDLIVFDASVFHGSRPVAGSYIRTTIHCVPHAISPQLTRLLAAIPSLPCRMALPEAQIPRIFDLICRLRRSQRAGRTKTQVKRLIETLFEEVSAAGAHSREPELHPVVRDVIRYMIEQPESDETVDQLARRFFVSEGHLYYLFQTHFGCSTARVWRAIKIERMCRELVKQERSVDELAASSGFASRRGFQRAFKRVTGMSVESYRARLGSQRH